MIAILKSLPLVEKSRDIRREIAAFADRADELAGWADRNLVNRRDTYGSYIAVEGRTDPKRTARTVKVAEGAPPIGHALVGHFRGESTGHLVGLHSAIPEIIRDGEVFPCTSRWGAIDLDCHGESVDRSAVETAAHRLNAKLAGIGLNVLWLDSNGAGGAHLVVLFDVPAPTADLHHFLKAVVGDYRQLGLAEDPEVFPRQAKVPEGGFGNWLRLPGRHHTRDHVTRVRDGSRWLEGEEAVEAILSAPLNSLPSIPPDMAMPPKRVARGNAPKLPNDLARDAKLAVEALRHYPNNDLHYDQWVEIGMALHEKLDVEGLAIWEKWSAESSKYAEGECAHKWRSFGRGKAGNVTLGTLFQHAKNGGYQPPKGRSLPALPMPRKAIEGPPLGVFRGDSGDQPTPDEPEREGPPEIRPNEAADDPHRLARIFRDARGVHPDGLTLRFWREEFLRWEDGRYRTVPPLELKAELNAEIKAEFDAINIQGIEAHLGRLAKGGEATEKAEHNGPPQARKVTASVVNNAALALTSYVVLPASVSQPTWIDPTGDDWSPSEILATRNALVHLPSLGNPDLSSTLPPTPRFFSPHCLDLEFDPEAPEPVQWLRFLGQLWPDDPSSIESLQEWAGYLLTADTSQQKILMLIGPKRSGKGTIGRVLTALVGPENVTNPTLGSLASEFGMAPLLGKLAAFVTDARLSGRMDAAAIAERMLSISGEDGQTVNRKHMSQVTAKLPTRFVVMSNELPRLSDASGALAGRMVILEMRHTFYGREDTALTARIMPELPGILLWAIEGWQRLNARGYFLQPASGQDLITQLEDLASPVGAFVRERCEIQPGTEIVTTELFTSWKAWCEEHGRKEAGDVANFSKNLRAVMPNLKTSGSVWRNDISPTKRVRVFFGIRLKTDADETDDGRF